jgi:hypothetical protein
MTAGWQQPRAMRLAILLCVFGSPCGGASSSTSTMPPPSPSTPSWADEFDGPTNTLPYSTKWTFDLGNNNGWGNQELETYTNVLQNVRLDGSRHLVIHLERSGPTDTSARIKTQGLPVFIRGSCCSAA